MKNQVDSPQELIQKALDLAKAYGTCDGSHHKMWVIDQMVRILTGNESGYETFLNNVSTGDGTCEPGTWEWEKGSAP